MSDHRLTRRATLRTLGVSLVAGPAIAGRSRATGRNGEAVEVNVGYASESGRVAAVERASSVRHEFGFDALTARLPARAVGELRARTDVRFLTTAADVGLTEDAQGSGRLDVAAALGFD